MVEKINGAEAAVGQRSQDEADALPHDEQDEVNTLPHDAQSNAGVSSHGAQNQRGDDTPKNRSADHDPYLLSSLNNALDVLDTLSHYDSLSLAELARLTGLGKTSLFRMMYTLERHGLVTKGADARYGLGLRLMYYGTVVADRQDIIDLAKPLMRRLSATTGYSVHLGRISRNRIITIHVENASADIQVTGRVGTNAPLYASAMGRAILANIDDDVLRDLAGSFTYKRYTSQSLQSAEELRALIHEVRERGYATDINERFRGFGSVAAPIFDHEGACWAAVSVINVAPVIEDELEECAAQVQELARDISAAIGYRSALDALA